MEKPGLETRRELARSGGVPTAVAYPVLTLCTGLAGGLWTEHPVGLGGVIAVLSLLGAIREWAGRKLSQAGPEELSSSYLTYACLVLIQAATWSVFAGFCVEQYPASWTSLMAILVTGGLVAGATASLTPHLVLMKCYIAVANLPVSLILLLSQSRPEAMVGVTLMTFCGFMLVVGTRNARRYHRLAQALEDLQKARKETERHRTSWQVLAEELRNLAAAQGEAVEKERIHLAREIHDDLGQLLTGLKLSLARLSRYVESDKGSELLLETNQLVDTTLGSVRRISSSLRPPLLDELGLEPALDRYLSEQCRRGQLEYQFKYGPKLPNLTAEQSLTAFRVCQEAVTNILRHAQARHVLVEVFAENGKLHVRVGDDGVGIQSEEGRSSLGLVGLRERLHLLGGRAVVSSSPGQGTVLEAEFPLQPLHQAP